MTYFPVLFFTSLFYFILQQMCFPQPSECFSHDCYFLQERAGRRRLIWRNGWQSVLTHIRWEVSPQEMDLFVTVFQTAMGLLSFQMQTQQAQGPCVCNHRLILATSPHSHLWPATVSHTQDMAQMLLSICGHYMVRTCSPQPYTFPEE